MCSKGFLNIQLFHRYFQKTLLWNIPERLLSDICLKFPAIFRRIVILKENYKKHQHFEYYFKNYMFNKLLTLWQWTLEYKPEHTVVKIIFTILLFSKNVGASGNSLFNKIVCPNRYFQDCNHFPWQKYTKQ